MTAHRPSPVRALGALALAWLAAPGPANAAGFAMLEYSARGVGLARAGGTANATREAATLFWNPAGMSLLRGSRVQVGATGLALRSRFSDQGSSRSVASAQGPVTLPAGPEDEQSEVQVVVPSLYWVTEVSPRLHLGIGMFSDFGLATEYHPAWAGRYQALKTDLRTFTINPSLAWRINPAVSVGVGLNASHAAAELTSAVPLADAAGAALPDALATVTGDDWSYGFNLGVLWQMGGDTRLGLAYRSKQDHDLSGSFRLTGAGALSRRVAARSGLNLPDTLMLGGHHRLDSAWSLMADLVWTRWSRYRDTRIRFADGTPDQVTSHRWGDSWQVMAGLEYRAGDHWTLRTGAGWDQSPVPDAQHRTPRMPDNDRRWLAAGLSWHPTPRLRVDLGYAHLFIERAAVDNRLDLGPAQAPGLFVDHLLGNFDSAADLLALQLDLRF
jgi:long-chain fatty acid transport protein